MILSNPRCDLLIVFFFSFLRGKKQWAESNEILWAGFKLVEDTTTTILQFDEETFFAEKGKGRVVQDAGESVHFARN